MTTPADAPAPSLAVTPEQVADLKQLAEKARETSCALAALRPGSRGFYAARRAELAALGAMLAALDPDSLLAVCAVVEAQERVIRNAAGALALQDGDPDTQCAAAYTILFNHLYPDAVLPPEPADAE